MTDTRGILFPSRLPTFHREHPPKALEPLVRWFWHPRWQLAPGEASRQEILPFPASNLVVSPDGVVLAGPTTRVAHRELSGSGWALGALLRPAGLASLSTEPWRLRDREEPIHAPELATRVNEALEDEGEEGRLRAVEVMATWLTQRLAPPDAAGLAANELEDLVARERTVVRVDQLAQLLGISVRTLQRLTRRHVGLTPLALVRRYRLQEAAQRVRDGEAGLAEIAAELGYVDQSHLTADFREMLGLTPASYRRSV